MDQIIGIVIILIVSIPLGIYLYWAAKQHTKRLNKRKENTNILLVMLGVNNKDYTVYAYNLKLSENTIEGLIVDSKQQPDAYTNYTMRLPNRHKKMFKIIVERISPNTLKFSTPEYK